MLNFHFFRIFFKWLPYAYEFLFSNKHLYEPEYFVKNISKWYYLLVNN